MKKVFYLLTTSVLLLLISCKKDKDECLEKTDDFNRTSMTTSWVNNLLLPSVNDLSTKINTLNTSTIAFTTTPNATTLAKARTDLFEAQKVWQHVEMFFFSTGYALDMYSYPVDVSKVTTNINSTTDIIFTRTLLNPTQGLPTMDYLLNGLSSTDQDIINKYSEAKYINYIKKLTSRMVTLTNDKISEFNNTKESNINSVDNKISSYFSLQINDFLQFTEKSFREAKIATPSGTRNRDKFPTISVSTSPNSVESVYSPENSKALYLESYDAIQDFYYGRSYTNDTETIGVEDYIAFLGTTVMVNNQDIPLTDYIKTLFTNINTANNNITDNFKEQTQNYNTNFDATFDAIQEFVVAIKSNTINAFGLTIDFVDSDGD